jgi:EAL domain-containing protein (putative c-di-GMP-specific phosphodiesterase class I)
MLDSLSRQTFQPRSVILREGERGDCAYLIESGRVEVSALRGGRSMRLAVLGKHDFFGEMALVDQTVRSATVTALETTQLVIIDGKRFRSEIDRAQPLMQMIVLVLVERLRSTGGRLLSYQSPETDPSDQSQQGSLMASLPSSAEMALNNLRLEHDLHRAVIAGELEMHYQPIVELRGEHVVGFEALMRWRHGDRGLLPPCDFIGLAEASGLIVPMGRFGIEQSCATLKRLGSPTPSTGAPLFMAINVSTQQLAEPTFVEELRGALDASGVDPSRIHLEITESVLMADPDRAVATLDRIKDLGVDISIDDFGTGYSSLSYLSRFPIDTLKIDSSFISTMASDPASQQIVSAIVRLAQSLELTLVAEGIEESRQQELLRELGCQYGQGYLFSKPLPPTELASFLEVGRPARDRGPAAEPDGHGIRRLEGPSRPP